MEEFQENQRLLAALRSGDATAAAELYRRYAPILRAAVRRQLHRRLRTRFDSFDFVQDVWASFLAMPPDRYEFESPRALMCFLTRVAYHKVVEVFRQRFETQKCDVARETSLEEAWPGRRETPSPFASPSQWAIAGERWEQLLSRVPPGHRVIVERLREGYDYADIARMTNVSVSTVNRIVRRLKDVSRL